MNAMTEPAVPPAPPTALSPAPEPAVPRRLRNGAAFVASWIGSVLILAAALVIYGTGWWVLRAQVFAALALLAGVPMLAFGVRVMPRSLVAITAASALAFVLSVPQTTVRDGIFEAATGLATVEYCLHQAAPPGSGRPDLLSRDAADLSVMAMLARGRGLNGPPHVTLVTPSGLWLWSFRHWRFVFWQGLRITEGVLQFDGRPTAGRPSLDQVGECLRWIGGNRLAGLKYAR